MASPASREPAPKVFAPAFQSLRSSMKIVSRTKLTSESSGTSIGISLPASSRKRFEFQKAIERSKIVRS